MLKEYKARSGQSVYDVCMIVYGSLDYVVKLCADSGLSDADRNDLSGVTFVYDTDFVANQAVQSFLDAANRGTNYFTPDSGCPIISGLSVDSTTPSSITVVWDSSPLAVGFEYVLTNTNTIPVSGWINTTSTTATILGLISGSTYYVWVRTICGAGRISAAASVEATTTVPEIMLWISPWLDPDITNPSPGDFMPYAMPPMSIFTGFTVVTLPTIVIPDEAAEDAYLLYLNSGFDPLLTGTFSRSSGVFSYAAGIGETPSVYGTIFVLYKRMKLTLTDMIATKPMGFRYRSGSGINTTQMVVEWGDGEDPNYYNTPAATTVVTHTFTATSTAVYVYHNDKVDILEFIENGLIYPANAKLSKIEENLPKYLLTLDISSCEEFADSESNVSGIDITMCDSLRVLSFRSNPALQGFSGLFIDLKPSLNSIVMQSNPLSTSTTNGLINTFVANSWTGATGGTIIITNSPAAAPSAPSATSRATLASAGWLQTYNP